MPVQELSEITGRRGLTGIQRAETAKKHNERCSHFLGEIRFCGIRTLMVSGFNYIL